MTTESAAKVKLAADRMTEARANLEAAIREARESGMSLRAIAEASGFSVETVRQISVKRPVTSPTP